MNEINCLSKVQIKFLKRVLWVPVTTPNAFVYLELGVLPIIYEIHKRQIRYLHKILNLERNDPILKTYKVLKVLPSNWVSNMEELRAKYNVCLDDEVVKRYNIEEFKKENYISCV